MSAEKPHRLTQWEVVQQLHAQREDASQKPLFELGDRITVEHIQYLRLLLNYTEALEARGDELERFLSLMHWVMPNLNDTFAYATADSEKLYMDGESNQEMLIKVFREYGFHGICAYVGRIRGADPIVGLQNEKYEKAKEMLKDWSYDPD
jgi:hypothetical protein